MLQGLIAPGQVHQPVLLHLGLGHGPGHGGQQQAEIHGLQLRRIAVCAVFRTAGLLGDGIPGRDQQRMLPVSPGIVSGGWVKQDHRGALQLLQLHIGLPEVLQGDAPALHPLSRQQQCQQEKRRQGDHIFPHDPSAGSGGGRHIHPQPQGLTGSAQQSRVPAASAECHPLTQQQHQKRRVKYPQPHQRQTAPGRHAAAPEQQQPHGYGSQDHPQQQAAPPGPARGPLQPLQGESPAFVVGVQLHGGGVRRVKQPAPGGGHVQGI